MDVPLVDTVSRGPWPTPSTLVSCFRLSPWASLDPSRSTHLSLLVCQPFPSTYVLPLSSLFDPGCRARPRDSCLTRGVGKNNGEWYYYSYSGRDPGNSASTRVWTWTSSTSSSVPVHLVVVRPSTGPGTSHVTSRWYTHMHDVPRLHQSGRSRVSSQREDRRKSTQRTIGGFLYNSTIRGPRVLHCNKP